MTAVTNKPTMMGHQHFQIVANDDVWKTIVAGWSDEVRCDSITMTCRIDPTVVGPAYTYVASLIGTSSAARPSGQPTHVTAMGGTAVEALARACLSWMVPQSEQIQAMLDGCCEGLRGQMARYERSPETGEPLTVKMPHGPVGDWPPPPPDPRTLLLNDGKLTAEERNDVIGQIEHFVRTDGGPPRRFRDVYGHDAGKVLDGLSVHYSIDADGTVHEYDAPPPEATLRPYSAADASATQRFRDIFGYDVGPAPAYQGVVHTNVADHFIHLERDQQLARAAQFRAEEPPKVGELIWLEATGPAYRDSPFADWCRVSRTFRETAGSWQVCFEEHGPNKCWTWAYLLVTMQKKARQLQGELTTTPTPPTIYNLHGPLGQVPPTGQPLTPEMLKDAADVLRRDERRSLEKTRNFARAYGADPLRIKRLLEAAPPELTPEEATCADCGADENLYGFDGVMRCGPCLDAHEEPTDYADDPPAPVTADARDERIAELKRQVELANKNAQWRASKNDQLCDRVKELERQLYEERHPQVVTRRMRLQPVERRTVQTKHVALTAHEFEGADGGPIYIVPIQSATATPRELQGIRAELERRLGKDRAIVLAVSPGVELQPVEIVPVDPLPENARVTKRFG